MVKTWYSDLPNFVWPDQVISEDESAEVEIEEELVHPHGEGYERIYPPESMKEYGSSFVRDERMESFVHTEFACRGGTFWDPEHAHLVDASMGVLWSNARHVVKGQEKAGQMELLPDPLAEPKTWSDARKRDWLAQMYGGDWPTFQMIISGVWAWRYDDREFLGLLDHELCHASIKRDEYGAPKFNDETGEPIWSIRGHDVEQFIGTVARWGAASTGTAELVAASLVEPRFSWVPGKTFLPAVCAACRQK